MSQYSSYKDNSITKSLANIERELIALKAKQPYSPSLINYGYKSNSVSIDSYEYISGSYDGICASLIFTSSLPHIYPRVNLIHEAYNRSNNASMGTALQYLRYEPISKNSCRIVVQTVGVTIPLSPNVQYRENFLVTSNTVGVLKLEKTYVLPNN